MGRAFSKGRRAQIFGKPERSARVKGGKTDGSQYDHFINATKKLPRVLSVDISRLKGEGIMGVKYLIPNSPDSREDQSSFFLKFNDSSALVDLEFESGPSVSIAKNNYRNNLLNAMKKHHGIGNHNYGRELRELAMDLSLNAPSVIGVKKINKPVARGLAFLIRYEAPDSDENDRPLRLSGKVQCESKRVIIRPIEGQLSSSYSSEIPLGSIADERNFPLNLQGIIERYHIQ